MLHVHDEYMLQVLTGVKDINILDLIEYIAISGKMIYVIDVYRLPIERKMSEFFEKIGSLHFNNKDENLIYYDLNRLISRFNNLFPYLSRGDYFMDKYRINLPDNFDFDKKYLIVNKKSVNYIKLRLCDSDYWSNILTSIFLTKIVIVKDYQTLDKGMGILYKKFKQQYKIPSNFLDELNNDRYFKYYNSIPEQELYNKEWYEKSTSNHLPYTEEESIFYFNLSLENQFYNFIQENHYIDNGCQCKYCKIKRQKIYISCLNNKYQGEIVDHEKNVNEFKYNVLEKIKTKINNIKSNSSKMKLSRNIYTQQNSLPSKMGTIKFTK